MTFSTQTHTMLYTKKIYVLCFLGLLIFSEAATAQNIVPVSQEPRHIPVLLNKYIRIIDAQIEDGDTSLFHIHATPSAFIFLTDLVYDNQILNMPWTKATSKKGHIWYDSYQKGPVTHRVGAPRNERIHAYDIELLSKFSLVDNPNWKLLPFDTAFNSDRCVGYKIELNSEKPSVQFSGRGPIVAILVSGEEITISQPDTRVQIGLEEEDYGYIRPGYACTIRLKAGEKASLVLFEIR